MPQYEVTGTNIQGKTVRVLVDADNVRGARMKAKAQGLVPLSVVSSEGGGALSAADPTSSSLKNVSIFGGVSNVEISEMTRQLAVLLKAHVPIVESLSAMVDQITKTKMKKILMAIRQAVKEGRGLAEGFAQFPNQFNRVYINMVKAGESSGRLDVVLMRLADFYENQVKQRNKVMGALAYPIIIMLVAIGALVLIFVKVIPTITDIFTDMKGTLPASTRFLIATSTFLQGYLWHILIGGLAVGLLFERYLKTKAGRERKDRFMLKLPIVGPLVRALAVSSFARTLATLLQSGVPMLQALEIARNVVNQSVFEQAIDHATTQVSEGRGLGVSLFQTKVFPPIMIHMIGVGEKTGELEPMLFNVSENYELQVDTTVNALTSLLSPIMIVGMVIFVGFIMMAILGPIFEMNQFAG
ncbi:MAG: type II secretion system F family protein [Bdellovibrionota bacterium]